MLLIQKDEPEVPFKAQASTEEPRRRPARSRQPLRGKLVAAGTRYLAPSSTPNRIQSLPQLRSAHSTTE